MIFEKKFGDRFGDGPGKPYCDKPILMQYSFNFTWRDGSAT